MSTDDQHIKRMKDLPSTHLLGAGTALCSGCGGLQDLKQAYDILGGNTVFVNAAGCMTLSSVYPFTPFRGSFLYTAMGAAPAGAQGIRDALDILKDSGRMDPAEDLDVVVITGDGSASGIGLGATSGAIDRGLDFLYLCYDNEGYANTGQQTSAATPHAARTSTNACGIGFTGFKKDLFALWAANNPAYVATVIGAEPLDLAKKFEKCRDIRGPKLVIALSPCPVGWGFDPEHTVEIGRLAVRTGLWPLKEYENGKIVHTHRSKKRPPVSDYLERQARFRHLFEPEPNTAVLEEIQAEVDRYWDAVEATEI